jgi:hypothetical protein
MTGYEPQVVTVKKDSSAPSSPTGTTAYLSMPGRDGYRLQHSCVSASATLRPAFIDFKSGVSARTPPWLESPVSTRIERRSCASNSPHEDHCARRPTRHGGIMHGLSFGLWCQGL